MLSAQIDKLPVYMFVQASCLIHQLLRTIDSLRSSIFHREDPDALEALAKPVRNLDSSTVCQ
jgi:hypothetical protein